MLQDGNQNAKQQWVQQNAYNKKGNLRKECWLVVEQAFVMKLGFPGQNEISCVRSDGRFSQ